MQLGELVLQQSWDDGVEGSAGIHKQDPDVLRSPGAGGWNGGPVTVAKDGSGLVHSTHSIWSTSMRCASYMLGSQSSRSYFSVVMPITDCSKVFTFVNDICIGV